ncbi:MAG: hypothetical protein ACK4SX_00650 [Alcanivoracaceae bacterium]
MTHPTCSKLVLPIVIGLASVSLSACKLSDLVGDDDDNTSFVALQGRAANADGPMAGATIKIKDANGEAFTVFSNASGYFSLRQDTSEEDYVELVAPIIVSTDYNTDTYNSVLCNIVYSNLSNAIDTVNVHAVTEAVMDATSSTDNAYSNWEFGAQGNYCNQAFAANFNDAANALDTTFNFFNILFDANGTGFDALQRAFNPEEFEPPYHGESRIEDSLGSIVNFEDGLWLIQATGNSGSDTISATREEQAITITLPDLRAFIEELIEEASEADITITSLTATIDGDGLGEVGTEVTANLRGSVALQGAAAIRRNFNIDVTVQRVGGDVGGPL